MTSAPPHRTPTPEVSSYPNYAQARARLRNFLRRGRKAYIRTKRYAYYRYSDTLLFARNHHTGAIYYITGSQRAGIENYKEVRAIIRRAGTLATASFHQPPTA